ncbi:MAG: phosphatidate cytidylyltransferase [Ruminococcaceae bacterium]|nr:phosphatidate cytidylyltransferase [Oscillospiraceae bacterium]
MKQRVLTGILIFVMTVLLIIFSGYIVYPIVIATLCVRAVFELLRVMEVEKKLALAIPAYVFATVFPICAYFVDSDTTIIYLLALAAAMFVYMLMLMGCGVFSRGKLPFVKIGEIFISVTYATVSFSSLSLMRYLDREVGVFVIVLVFLVSWACDTGAYFTGMLFGKHKLIPEISPKKTVEGAIGGIVIATLAYLLYGFVLDKLIPEMSVNYIFLGVCGLLLSIFSQLGDLVASLIKREYGVKDYGRIFPGHGGVMDRFDSTISVSTVLMILCAVLPPFSL